MEAIFELQRQLKQVQQNVGLHKFNERNVVDLITQLISLRLIYTQNGKEYLTPEELDKEIKEQIYDAGGRINIIEIPNRIGISYESIDARLEEFLKKEKTIQIVNRELITDQYLDSIAMEINQSLQDLGQIYVSDLTIKFSLSIEFLKELIESRLETMINAKIQGNKLYTSSYFDREKCKIRGIFTAVTRPIATSQIISTFKLDENTFYIVLDELTKSGEIKGKVQSGVYTPECFLKTKERWVVSFYKQNNYVEYDKLTKFGIQNPKKYISDTIPGGIHLQNFYINSFLLDKADSNIQEAVNTNSWIDLYLEMPSLFTEGDIRELLKHCENTKKASIFETYVCSNQYIDKAIESLSGFLDEKAAKISSGEEKKQPAQPAKVIIKKKGKGRKDSDSEENAKQNTKFPISQEEIKNVLESAGSSLDQHAKDNTGFVMAMSEYLHERILGILSDKVKSMQERTKSKSSKIDPKLNDNIERQVQELQIVLKSLEAIRKHYDPQHFGPIEQPILVYQIKHFATPLLNNLMIFQAHHNEVKLDAIVGLSKNADGSAAIKVPNDRTLIRKELPKHIREIFAELEKLITSKDLPTFIEHLVTNASNLAARIKFLDKKIEKSLTHSIKMKFKDELKNDGHDYSHMFYTIIQYKLAEQGLCFRLPNENWALAIMTSVINQGTKYDDNIKKIIMRHQKVHEEYSILEIGRAHV